MKTIKEIKDRPPMFEVGYEEAKEDVLKLIDEMLKTERRYELEELKQKIQG